MGLFGSKHATTEHRYAEERLSAYLDGELSPQERERVERHVGSCADCRWEVETLHRTAQWTRDLPRLPVPRAFTIPVPAQPARAVRRAWGLPVLQGATALVAVLFFLAVAGEALFPRFLSAFIPQMGAAHEQAVQVAPQPTQAAAVAPLVEATVPVEKAASAPVASPLSLAGTRGDQATGEANGAAATPVPQPIAPPPAATLPAMGMGAVEATSVATQGATVGATLSGLPTPTPPAPTESALAAEATCAEARVAVSGLPTETAPVEPTATAVMTETAPVEPTATEATTQAVEVQVGQVLSPTVAVGAQPSLRAAAPPGPVEPSAVPAPALAPAGESPTTVAEVQAPAPAPVAQDHELSLQRQQSFESGLGTLVLVLGIATVLLGTATLVLMVRRLRRS